LRGVGYLYLRTDKLDPICNLGISACADGCCCGRSDSDCIC
jgi:hypothetical protein